MGIGGNRSMDKPKQLLCDKLTGNLESASPLQPQKIVFSFAYFRQIEYFGLGGCSTSWFTSIFDRFVTLSALTQKELQQQRDSYRYHPINWKQKNIPIQRHDLFWVPNGIIENEEEIDFFQLSVSKGNGRFIGYWGDVDTAPSTFFIVLFDPEHNIQPSQKHNYQIRPTTVSKTQYDALKERVDRALKDKTCTQVCKLRNILQNPDDEKDYILYTKLDRQLEEELSNFLEKYSIADLLAFGMVATLEDSFTREFPNRVSHLITLLQEIQNGNHPLT